MIALIVVSIVVGIFTAWWYLYQKYDKHLKKFRGPPPLPLIGNALEFGSTAELLPTLLRLQGTYGDTKMTIGFGAPTLFITDCKFLEYLLGSTKVLDKSEDYKYLNRWLGTGLLTSGSTKWKKHRKILTPAFHFQILEHFVEVFDLYSNTLVRKLAQDVGKDSVDIYPYITRCSLDIICATSMGTNVNAQENVESQYVYSVKEMCRIIVERSVSIFKMHDFFYYMSRDYQKERRAVKILHDYTYSVIESRKKELMNVKNNVNDVDDIGTKAKKTFLDLLLQYKKDGQSISDEDIREEVDTFMFEGHDTTASAMSFILYCLAAHSEIQETVVQELNTIFADDKSRATTYRDLQEMKYLEAVIKETLRLYPSVPFYARNVHEDVEYDDGILPKNLTLVVFAYGLHRNPEIYTDPERFDPERFTPENQATRSPYAYIPFSAGPRNCIGQKFAMLEMKSVVSKVLRNYELLASIPEHKLILVSEIVLKSSTGVCIRLKKRFSTLI